VTASHRDACGSRGRTAGGQGRHEPPEGRGRYEGNTGRRPSALWRGGDTIGMRQADGGLMMCVQGQDRALARREDGQDPQAPLPAHGALADVPARKAEQGGPRDRAT